MRCLKKEQKPTGRTNRVTIWPLTLRLTHTLLCTLYCLGFNHSLPTQLHVWQQELKSAFSKARWDAGDWLSRAMGTALSCSLDKCPESRELRKRTASASYTCQGLSSGHWGIKTDYMSRAFKTSTPFSPLSSSYTYSCSGPVASYPSINKKGRHPLQLGFSYC